MTGYWKPKCSSLREEACRSESTVYAVLSSGTPGAVKVDANSGFLLIHVAGFRLEHQEILVASKVD